MTTKIWILAEMRDGQLGAVLELAAAARRLAPLVEAFSYGPATDVRAGASVLGAHGVTHVVHVDLADGALPGPGVAAVVADAIAARGAPDAVVFPSTYDGRDIAARLSARIDRPVLTNVTGLTEDDGILVSEHTVFGGTELVRACFTHDGPAIFVVRPKSFVAEAVVPVEPTVEHATPSFAPVPDAARIVNRATEYREGPSLEDTSIVVSGGRGLGVTENFALIEQLADVLHGAPGASRAVVDAGWVPYSYQIGQTGKTVKPEVYVACGISGATQHLVGMKGAQHVIAINLDPAAPIFRSADLGVVADVTELLPRLLRALEAEG